MNKDELAGELEDLLSEYYNEKLINGTLKEKILNLVGK